MFISTLATKLEQYDPYGEHRINGVKTIYVLFILFTINLIYAIPNAYFYFFYIPMTSFSTEVTAFTLIDKYKQFLYASIGSVISVFLFNMVAVYPSFFVLFIFAYTLLLYIIAIHWVKPLFPSVAIILSLASYSLIYGQVSTDFYLAFNNLLVTIVAILIVISALFLFPLSYYYQSWLRAFRLLLKQIKSNLESINTNIEAPLVQGNLVMMYKYANLLPKKLPTFTILKINILINELRLLSCIANKQAMSSEIRNNTINGINQLINAIEQYKTCKCNDNYHYTLNKIINSWNSLCIKT